MRLITGNEFGIAVCAALGIDPTNVSRLVIDAQVDCALKVIVERNGDDRIFNAVDLLDGSFAEITVSGKEEK